jgi:hypothetical protein
MMEVILHSRDRSIECLNWTNQDCRLWIRFQSAITQGKISWFSITWPSSIYGFRLPLWYLQTFFLNYLVFQSFYFERHLMTVIPETRHAH